VRSLPIVLLLACGGEPKPVPVLANAAPPDAAVRDAAVPVDAPAIAMTEDDAKSGAEAFQELVGAATPAITKCFDKALKATPTMQQTNVYITTSFAGGKATSVTVSPSLGAPFDGCVKAIGSGWTMSMPGAMTFRVKLNFTP
jgi:hypothetical protein